MSACSVTRWLVSVYGGVRCLGVGTLSPCVLCNVFGSSGLQFSSSSQESHFRTCESRSHSSDMRLFQGHSSLDKFHARSARVRRYPASAGLVSLVELRLFQVQQTKRDSSNLGCVFQHFFDERDVAASGQHATFRREEFCLKTCTQAHLVVHLLQHRSVSEYQRKPRKLEQTAPFSSSFFRRAGLRLTSRRKW